MKIEDSVIFAVVLKTYVSVMSDHTGELLCIYFILRHSILLKGAPTARSPRVEEFMSIDTIEASRFGILLYSRGVPAAILLTSEIAGRKRGQSVC
jgi:hypothetical protein